MSKSSFIIQNISYTFKITFVMLFLFLGRPLTLGTVGYLYGMKILLYGIWKVCICHYKVVNIL